MKWGRRRRNEGPSGARPVDLGPSPSETQKHILTSRGFLEVSRGFSRFLEVSRGFSRFLQVSRDFSGFLEVSRDFSRFLEVSRGFSRFLEVSRGFSRFLEVSRGFSRFLDISRGFSRISRAGAFVGCSRSIRIPLCCDGEINGNGRGRVVSTDACEKFAAFQKHGERTRKSPKSTPKLAQQRAQKIANTLSCRD